MTTMNIYQRINAVRKALGYVQKDKSVSAGAGGNYKAVTHDAVTGMVRQHLIEHGVIIVPNLVRSVFHSREEGAKQRLYEADYCIKFVNMDAPEEFIDVTIGAHAMDNQDKAPGKAISYATKYAILKLMNIETGEDEESRYQHEEFDVAPYIARLYACQTFGELKEEYSTNVREILDSNDKVAIKAYTKAKDAAKAKLDEQVPA